MRNKVKMAKFNGNKINIVNATFGKSAYLGKIIHGLWPFSQTSGFGSGMVGTGGVVVRK